MKLIHYSDRPLRVVESRKQESKKTWGPCAKPNGLWVSAEGVIADDWDWKRWCEAESFRLERLTYATEIHLKPDADILRINNLGDFGALEEAFGLPDSRSKGINWERVANLWQGIIIAPYQWERRLSGSSWYYPWDCASGCIWDADAVTFVELVSEPTEL